MEKNNAVLQITANNLRLLIGYVLDDKVYVMYALTNPIPSGIIEDGKVVNYQALVDEIKKITQIKDSAAKLLINISDVTLCLPPVGLNVFLNKQTTTIVADDSRVGFLDVRNLYSLISKEHVANENKIVDIIPTLFTLDGNRQYDSAPIGEVSNSLTMDAMVHTLPRHIIDDYCGAVKAAGIHVSRCVISSFGACEALKELEGIPDDYFLVDIGGKNTTVSLIGKNQLYDSKMISWGGDNITDHIVDSFHIVPADAKKYKELYGLSNRKLSFEPIICKVEDAKHNVTQHTLKEFNEIIKDELQKFVDGYNEAVNSLLSDYPREFRNYPVVLIGGGSLLAGLTDFVLPKIDNEVLYLANPKTMGARHPSFFTCLGVMKASSKYHNVYDETHPKISSVSRNNK